MKACCGANCSECPSLKQCGGCNKCKGKPFGGNCFAYKYINNKGKKAFTDLKLKLVNEINSLNIKGLLVDDLNLLMGAYVNLEYKLDNKTKVKYLNDNEIYFGNQICINDKKCYGVVCNEKMILVCTYGNNGSNPKLVLYKHK